MTPGIPGDHQVDPRQRKQDHHRSGGTHQGIALTKTLQGFAKGGSRQRKGQGEQQHQRGVAQGKEQAHPGGGLAFLQQLAGGVIDGGDVVGIHGMAQAKAIGQSTAAEQKRVPLE